MSDLYLFEGGGFCDGNVCCSPEADLPNPCCKLGLAAHNYPSERSDNRRIQWGEYLVRAIKENPPAVDDYWVTHLLPIDTYQKFVTFRMNCATAGLTFDVEIVGITEDGDCWALDEADVTAVFSVDLGTYDEDDCTVNRRGFIHDPVLYMTETKVLRIKFTAVPADLFDVCSDTGLNFELSITDSDPCFMDQMGGDCTMSDGCAFIE